MGNKAYRLTFLPLFEDDLNEIVDYITFELNNHEAANRLVDDVIIYINSPPTKAHKEF